MFAGCLVYRRLFGYLTFVVKMPLKIYASVFTESVIMAPFRWPETRHDIALATEVTACNPVKPSDWENLAARLSELFPTESAKVELKGRGCRERVDRLIEKFKAEDAKALKR